MGCHIILGRNLKFPAVVHSCRNNPSDMISDKGALIFYNLVTCKWQYSSISRGKKLDWLRLFRDFFFFLFSDILLIRHSNWQRKEVLHAIPFYKKRSYEKRPIEFEIIRKGNPSRNCEKLSKLNKNCQRIPVFWRFSEFHSICHFALKHPVHI